MSAVDFYHKIIDEHIDDARVAKMLKRICSQMYTFDPVFVDLSKLINFAAQMPADEFLKIYDITLRNVD